MNSINENPKPNPASQNNFYSPENNLIQNFYIIGFSPEDFFKIKGNEKEKTGEFENIFKTKLVEMPKLIPKLITKFPNDINTLNLIPDDIVISHCFPEGHLNILQKSKGSDYPKTSFQFELDNKHHNYKNEYENLYSKIYFTCLEIGEPISDYFFYKKEIINSIYNNNSIKILNYDKNNIESIDLVDKYKDFIIPKVICFASVLPFYNELNFLLKDIFEYYTSYKDFSFLPLEKVIEKIVTEIPIPIKFGTELNVSFKTPNYKEKVIFPLFNANELNIKYSADMSLVDLFKYFSVDEIIRVFKYILYEIPILFFSEDKLILSLLVDTFLTVLSPFNYVFPHISILPSKLYGLIDSEQKFIFGINENYNDKFFRGNNIELDKTIVAINIKVEDRIKKIAKVTFDEKIFDSSKYGKYQIERKGLLSHYEEYTLVNGNRTNIINIDIPYNYKKLLTEGLNKYISFMKKKSFFSKKESIPKDFNLKIQNVFYKFFINILSGYTEFLINSPSFYSVSRNIGEKILFKHRDNFIKNVFNSDEFINKSQKESQIFFYIFSKTRYFQNFFKERIYNNNSIALLSTRQFDILTYLKKHSDYRKKKENKQLYDNFKKDIIEKTKNPQKEEINIIDETFPDEYLKNLIKKEHGGSDILIKYGQLIKLKNSSDINNIENVKDNLSNLIEIKYCIFPKLDFKYLDNKDKILTSINASSYISSFDYYCRRTNEDFESKRPYICYENLFTNMNINNKSNNNNDIYEIPQNSYINYIWLILISSSLWYCLEEEKNYRQDKLFEVLSKMEYIEEYVLDIIYINLYYYGDKIHFVKMYILYNRLKGQTNYYFLNLLCNKVVQLENNNNIKEIINIDDEEEQSDLNLSKRYLIKLSNEFGRKRKNKKSDIEEIIFSTEQLCDKCNEIVNINPKEIINDKCNLNENNYKYKCNKCKEDKDIIIKYQELLYNYDSQEGFLNKTGEFQMLTPYKLYCNLKNYLVEKKDLKLEIKNIFDIEEKLNLKNILLYFSLLNLSFDFLLPYEIKVTSSMKMLLEEFIGKQIKEKELIRITYKDKDEVSHVVRKFNNITPQYNIKKKYTFLIFDRGMKYVESDLSFTIKNSKKKKKK